MILVYLLGISVLGFIGWKLKVMQEEIEMLNKSISKLYEDNVILIKSTRDGFIKSDEMFFKHENRFKTVDFYLTSFDEKLKKLEKVKTPKKEKKNAK